MIRSSGRRNITGIPGFSNLIKTSLFPASLGNSLFLRFPRSCVLLVSKPVIAGNNNNNIVTTSAAATYASARAPSNNETEITTTTYKLPGRSHIYSPSSPSRPRGFNFFFSGTPIGETAPSAPCLTPLYHQYYSYHYHQTNYRKKEGQKSRSSKERTQRHSKKLVITSSTSYYYGPTLAALVFFTLVGSLGIDSQTNDSPTSHLPEQADSILDSATSPTVTSIGYTKPLESKINPVITCLIGQESDGDLIKASSFTSELQALLLVVLNVTSRWFWPFGSSSDSTQATNTDNIAEMTTVKSAPGRTDTLTAEQEAKLKELWGATLKLFGRSSADLDGTEDLEDEAEDVSEASTPARVDSELSLDKKKKKKWGLSRTKKGKDRDDASVSSSRTGSGTSTPRDSGILSASTESDDKYGLTKDFRHAIANLSPEELRNNFAAFGKFDHPDALLLRFLRARKWDVEKALVMMVSTIRWRAHDVQVEKIVGEGELDALKSGDEGFMKQLRMGKSFIHGLDKEGRPICVVRVHLHRSADQPPEAIEKYTVYLIETARMMLTPPVDTACVLFDMSKFGLANMDYAPVKFMIKCFEAHYPESLGVCLVHNAPWVFSSIWSIIKGWLDPVVAAKVHFTKGTEGLEEFIHKSQIITELGGDEKWEYKYVKPVDGENSAQLDTAARDKLQKEREELYDAFEANTRAWIKEPNTGSDSGTPIKEERKELVKKLRDNYWKLDKYIRAKTWYDRTGVVSGDGKIDFYGTKAANGKATAPAGMDIDID